MTEVNIQKAIKILKLQYVTLSSLLCAQLLEKLKKRTRRWWVKPHLLPQIRDNIGAYAIVCHYFEIHDHEEFESQFTLSFDNFQTLYNLIGHRLEKQLTKF